MLKESYLREVENQVTITRIQLGGGRGLEGELGAYCGVVGICEKALG